VPRNAVVFEGDAAHVFVALDDGSLAVRPIQVGRSHDEYLEVREGLRNGEQVVSAGALFLDRAIENREP
jgi:cobalt-zinc-cadmium efflux system membrane fusion protein